MALGHYLELETQFLMPEGYRRQFVLSFGMVKATIIYSSPDRMEYTDTWDRLNKEQSSMVLDWMLETRQEVEKDIVTYKRK